jgi:hypothetical protein
VKAKTWIVTASVVSLCLLNSGCAQAQFGQVTLPQAMQNARNLEVAGRWNEAGLAWYRVVMEQVAGPPGTGNLQMPMPFRQYCMRRAIACYTRAANDSDPMDGSDPVTPDGKQMLLGMYQQMTRLEPDNPLWDLLLAQAECARGAYVEAKTYLMNSVARTGGDPRVRARAQLLLSHIANFQDADWQRIAAEDAATADKRRRMKKVPQRRIIDGHEFYIIDPN